jgi:uncharacterized protein (UPF0332 family)
MNPEDFISLAGWLAANTAVANAEARFRTAVSRAYYGAFLTSVDVLAQLGVVVPANHRGHEVAVKKLLGSGHRRAVLASRFIGELRSRRNDADYNLKTVKYRQQGNAMLAVQDAANAILELRACLDEPARSELRELLART